ncbi:MAG: hypothetical protein HRU03_01795 [Nanoarchaeales archaeon]|nr:hypothetical protein [Nanoarchaeales archaeon]
MSKNYVTIMAINEPLCQNEPEFKFLDEKILGLQKILNDSKLEKDTRTNAIFRQTRNYYIQCSTKVIIDYNENKYSLSKILKREYENEDISIIGSIKGFTHILVHLLYKNGTLSIDREVEKYNLGIKIHKTIRNGYRLRSRATKEKSIN